MQDVLDLVEADRRAPGWSGDVRPAIITAVKILADFVPVSRDQHRRIATALERAREEISGVPQHAYLDAVLARAIADSEHGARRGARVTWQRHLLAAAVTYDLLLDNGLGAPTLTAGGKYVHATALLLEIATGTECSDSAVARACSQHFRALQKEALEGLHGRTMREEVERNPWPYSRRGRRPPEPPSSNDEVTALVAADARQHRRRLVAEARSCPPLERLLDEMLR
jgi:hypothetical protein